MDPPKTEREFRDWVIQWPERWWLRSTAHVAFQALLLFLRGGGEHGDGKAHEIPCIRFVSAQPEHLLLDS